MSADHREYDAPWGRLLKGFSGGVMVLLAGIAAGGMASGSPPGILILPFLPVLALPFIIRGYAVSDGMLVIKRLGWVSRIPLAGLRSVEVDPHALKRSIRLCGNGGLFAFTGLYRNKALGNFRAFVNDLNRTVVLRFPGRTVVVSPEDPVDFAGEINRRKNA